MKRIQHGVVRTFIPREHARARCSITVGFIESVSETFCATCNAWIETNGFVGPLMFSVKHRHDHEMSEKTHAC